MEPRVPGEPLGVIAGGGQMPRIVAEAARARGFHPIVVRIADAIDDDWSAFDGAYYPWGKTGDAIRFLRRRGVARVVTCGTVSRRPDFRAILPSFATLAILPTALRVVRGGDDRLLRNVAAFLRAEGLEPLAVQDVAPQLLAPSGVISGREPGPQERAALVIAATAAAQLGSLDVGQAVVASQERVIALEAAEGTREMLQRVADLKRRGRIGRAERLVLVKAIKPQQDERFDLPSIGVSTIVEAEAAGVSAIGVSAGKSLVIDYDALVAAAREAWIAVVGLAADQGAAPTMDAGPLGLEERR
ncbi:UDP-2,3-diacylglucosamine diphosphatase LpxI [Jiella sp. MQZ9-1]|uniref:UDP-2,3-diacylglucosamine diphosphatase LpxI n=1 Tax=Jiella flava TaxID=2816857 RepID=A0A939FUU5_9HYPH|nr:UDP-2,3-diacylglucosamine diphosphatase LpxI [Jiella flava]MBO0662363.1 UDP-2,3-diacylglucosamine diphosphatase LpxI [Jiella flava]MCD2470807.1 UDP-2,3-diacylglucosamine diphosphatase LpxI [Jiella flava]